MTHEGNNRGAEVVEQFYNKSTRYLIEGPENFAAAHWPRDADVATIARCILGTLKYEPHAVDTTVLRRALEGVIEHTAGGGISQETKDYDRRGEDSEQIRGSHRHWRTWRLI